MTMKAESLAATTEADFFKHTPRPSTRDAEALERARTAAEPAKHRHSLHLLKKHTAQEHRKKTQARAPSRTHVMHEVGLLLPACQVSLRPKSGGSMSARRAGERRPRPIHKLFSEGSESSSTSDATTARWYEAFETHVAASQPTFRKSRRLGRGSVHGRGPSPQSTRRSECSSSCGVQTFGCRPDARKRN